MEKINTHSTDVYFPKEFKPSLRPTTILNQAFLQVHGDRTNKYRYYALRLLENAIIYVREMRALDTEKEFWREDYKGLLE